ncbi:kinase-like domain-containing protein [Halteromyces radiatus]|uniref:kinase-like domain-containing protein n=1 Tax=Halteromyces radiatus TaxID=101107 RepID=UPI002220E662|nr:kinase-like domain-containing protein [Halteromyces radiatus]KAI8089182.1 kinase-like domain-containing protein [Halteromyces radiatus]
MTTTSRLCVGYDDSYIYALDTKTVTSFDIQKQTISSSHIQNNSAQAFVTCYGSQNQLYITNLDLSGELSFQSYHQINTGSHIFDTTFPKQLDATSIISVVPFTDSGNQSNTNSSCIMISANDRQDVNGLYQICSSSSVQQIPFSDTSSTAPLLATNKDNSSIILLGYPTANSISVYTDLNELSNPTTTYDLNFYLPSKGSVQVLDDQATEFLIYDYNRTIIHIQLPTANQPNGKMKRGIPSYNNTVYQLEDDLSNGNVIALPDHRVFTVSNKNTSNNVMSFTEIPLLVGSRVTPRQNPPTSATTVDGSSQSSSSLSSQTIYIIIGVAIGCGACILLLLIWFIRRRLQSKRRDLFEGNSTTTDRFEKLDDKLDSLPLYTDHPRDEEMGDFSHDINNSDDHGIQQQQQQQVQQVGSSSKGSNSLGRGLSSILSRMSSLRSSPGTSFFFSIFNNGSSLLPVEDKYQKVKQVTFRSGVAELMEPPTTPDVNGTLILNGRYQVIDTDLRLDENIECNNMPGYTTRTIEHAYKANTIRTLHYYTKDQRDVFLRNINATVALKASKRVIRHHDALSLSTPTRQGQYKYFWISTPCKARQSLYSLVHDEINKDGEQPVVDIHQSSFLTLSILSLLMCMRDVHAADYCHLDLSLQCFFYQQVSTITEWYVGGFHQARIMGQQDGHPLPLTRYSAPELVQQQHMESLCPLPRQELDCWSLGCVIYELVTAKPLFKDIRHLTRLARHPSAMQRHLSQAIQQDALSPSIRACLTSLLQIDPFDREPIQLVLDTWMAMNELDDDDDD